MTFTCLFCVEAFESSGDFFTPSACLDHHSACLGCWRRYIEQKFVFAVGRPVNGISCIGGCARMLLPEEISRLCPGILARPIACGYPGCSGVLNENRSRCLSCFRPTCPTCVRAQHPGLTCLQNLTKLAMLSAETIHANPYTEDTHPCPSCATPVVRESTHTCLRMDCPVCGVPFCWDCHRIVTANHAMLFHGPRRFILTPSNPPMSYQCFAYDPGQLEEHYVRTLTSLANLYARVVRGEVNNEKFLDRVQLALGIDCLETYVARDRINLSTIEGHLDLLRYLIVIILITAVCLRRIALKQIGSEQMQRFFLALPTISLDKFSAMKAIESAINPVFVLDLRLGQPIHASYFARTISDISATLRGD